ncbi:MAG: hypothetical protein ACI4EM_05745, partial [Hominisplanchenecus sp.]
MNVNLSSVIFSSVLSGTSGHPGAEYKLTLQDNEMTITAGTFTLTNDMKTGSYYYYVVAEDVNGDKSTDYASAPVQITIPASVSKFTVTVTDGTLSGGSTTGDYAQGETVTITADAAPDGQQFKEWEVVNGNITLADSTSATTTFTMPAEAVSVKANYEAIPATAPGITMQPGGGAANPGGGGSANPNIPGSPATPNTTYQIIDGANSSWTLGSREG